MRILMVTAEYAPFAKAGGLADMVTGLSRTLVTMGHDVRVVLPRYALHQPNASDQHPSRTMALGDLRVSPVVLDGTHPAWSLQQLPAVPGSEPLLWLVDAPAFFGSGAIYGGGEREARRFALLAHAALQACEAQDWSPEIIHCHDWHAALVPVLLGSGYADLRTLRGARTVLTIHNIGYQGVFPASLAPDLGIVDRATDPVATELSFLRDGITAADALTTVSPTHAGEILTPEYGKGLDGLLRQRQDRLVGILNGVDYTAWNPATDPHLPAHYDAARLGGKSLCRQALSARAGLDPTQPGPLLGMVTRLAEQKGLELVLEGLPALLDQRRLQLVVVGQGEARYGAALRQLEADFPGRCRYFDLQDETLARLVFAGSDAFLVPSIYEPCGLTQMYALRYGSIPIVRETGGLKDTVRHFDPGSGIGTGSVFKHADANGLTWAIGEVLDWFGHQDHWNLIQQNGMAADFSWKHQAPHYAALYARLSGPGRGRSSRA